MPEVYFFPGTCKLTEMLETLRYCAHQEHRLASTIRHFDFQTVLQFFLLVRYEGAQIWHHFGTESPRQDIAVQHWAQQRVMPIEVLPSGLVDGD